MATAKPGPLTEILQQLSQGLEQVSKNVNEARTKHEARLIDPTNLQKKFPNLFQLHTNQEDTVTTAKPYTYDDFIANNPFRAKSTTDPKDELIAQLQKRAKNRKAELKKLNDTVLKTKAIAQSRLDRLDQTEIDLKIAYQNTERARDSYKALSARYDELQKRNDDNLTAISRLLIDKRNLQSAVESRDGEVIRLGTKIAKLEKKLKKAARKSNEA